MSVRGRSKARIFCFSGVVAVQEIEPLPCCHVVGWTEGVSEGVACHDCVSARSAMGKDWRRGRGGEPGRGVDSPAAVSIVGPRGEASSSSNCGLQSPAMSTRQERVEIRNSFLHLARNSIVELVRAGNVGSSPRRSRAAGDRLSEQRERVLAALAFCTLAIEARINHLAYEEREANRITEKEFDAILHLPPQHKWFLLP